MTLPGRGVIHGYAFGGAPAFNGTKPLPEPKQFMPPYVRSEMRGAMHSGAISSNVAGRTDQLPMNVRRGSYVVPADVTSALGQGNSAAGHSVLNRMFGTGPYGVGLQSQHGSLMRPPAAPRPLAAPGGPSTLFGGKSGVGFANGGGVGSSVPIKAAGGEHVLPPEVVAAIGHGNVDHGCDILDEWVKKTRAELIKTLKSLPGPAGAKKK